MMTWQHLLIVVVLTIVSVICATEKTSDKGTIVLVAPLYSRKCLFSISTLNFTSGSHAQFNHRMLAILKHLNYDVYLLAFYDYAHADVKFDIEPRRFATFKSELPTRKIHSDFTESPSMRHLGRISHKWLSTRT